MKTIFKKILFLSIYIKILKFIQKMIGQLITTAQTYNEARININNAFSSDTSFNTMSANTIYSTSTNLYDIFQVHIADTKTYIQNGLNTYTAGTSDLTSVNISSATLYDLSVSGSASFNILSANTIYSGSSLLQDVLPNYYTTGATLSTKTLTFGRNDNASAYSVLLEDLHEQNTDTYLASGTTDEISAEYIKTNMVPYTGATQDVILSGYNFTTEGTISASTFYGSYGTYDGSTGKTETINIIDYSGTTHTFVFEVGILTDYYTS